MACALRRVGPRGRPQLISRCDTHLGPSTLQEETGVTSARITAEAPDWLQVRSRSAAVSSIWRWCPRFLGGDGRGKGRAILISGAQGIA